MRIPGSHPPVMELIDQFGLKKRRFHYVDIDAEGNPANRTWIHVNGIRVPACRLRPCAPAREPVVRRAPGPLGHLRSRQGGALRVSGVPDSAPTQPAAPAHRRRGHRLSRTE
jgi:monoamine oxidase